MVREAVDVYITRSMPNRPLVLERAASVTGKFSSGRRDISAKHDSYLAEASGTPEEAPGSPEEAAGSAEEPSRSTEVQA